MRHAGENDAEETGADLSRSYFGEVLKGIHWRLGIMHPYSLLYPATAPGVPVYLAITFPSVDGWKFERSWGDEGR